MFTNLEPNDYACDECQECTYFLHDLYDCRGEREPCLEFSPKIGSKYRKIEIEVSNERSLSLEET